MAMLPSPPINNGWFGPTCYSLRTVKVHGRAEISFNLHRLIFRKGDLGQWRLLRLHRRCGGAVRYVCASSVVTR